MAALALRRDEASALAVAAVLHAALIGVLLLQPEERTPAPEPERVVVSLSEEVGMTSTSPDPVAVSRAAQAPVFSELPSPPPPSLTQVTPPQTQPSATPPRPSPRPSPAPSARPRPAATSAPRPQPTRAARPAPAPTRAARPAPAPTRAARPAPASTQAASNTASASRIGSDFLPGAGTSTTSTETRIPASQIGGSAKASLLAAITRELRPHWNAPNGVDAELLVTPVSWRLSETGALQGSPSCGTTRGITDSNRPQAERHCELAIRAVRLAAPFDLPDRYYNAWKSVRNFEFSGEL